MTIVADTTESAQASRVLAQFTAPPDIDLHDRLPGVTACPAWCTNEDHSVAGRNKPAAAMHQSRSYYLPKVRSEQGETGNGKYRMASVQLSLGHYQLERDPHVSIRELSRYASSFANDQQVNSQVGTPIKLTLDEALTLARALVELVDVAQGTVGAPASEEPAR